MCEHDNSTGSWVNPVLKIPKKERPSNNTTLESLKIDIHKYKIKRMHDLCAQMIDTYARKNKAYGDSFSETIKDYGFIAALVRIRDKFNRIEALIQGVENEVPDESLLDTLNDMACYCLMTILSFEEKKINEEINEFPELIKDLEKYCDGEEGSPDTMPIPEEVLAGKREDTRP